MSQIKTILIILCILFLGGVIFYFATPKDMRLAAQKFNNSLGLKSGSTKQSVSSKAAKYAKAPELIEPDGYINTDKITINELIGKKIIMVDFWTYSCINCQRTTPYLNAWYEKYKDQGLEIIGVHTPEFEFEKDYDNVLTNVKNFGIKYPVVQDNDYQTWNAYFNRYWPRKYLIDIDGFVVYDHIGEGGYEETEKIIQKLLTEKMERDGGNTKNISANAIDIGVQEVPEAESPETYFGSARNQNLGNGARGVAGEQTLAPPKNVGRNELYLVGPWSFKPEFAQNLGAAKVIFKFKAKSVYFVGSAEQNVEIKITKNGKPLGLEAGEDVVLENGQSYLNVKEDRLYTIIKDPSGVAEHTLEMIIESPGLKAFAFTFG